MKVSIYQTVEVDDEQRVMLADLNDGERSKRQATRNEFKNYIWLHGEHWQANLKRAWEEHPAVDDADLLGAVDEAESLI